MPEPSQRPPWRVHPGLGGWPFWFLVEQRVTVVIACEACPNFTKWSPEDIARKSRQARGKNFNRIAARLRCSRCKSEWVTVSLAPGCHLASVKPGCDLSS